MTNSESIFKTQSRVFCKSVRKQLRNQLKIGRGYEGLLQRKANIDDFQMYEKISYMIHNGKCKLRL